MEFSFFQSLLFGFVSGLTDILPVSAQAHKTIMLTVFGGEGEPALLRLLLHIAILAALYTGCSDQLRRISRQLKLAKVPKRRRKRPLDQHVLMDFRLLRMMAVPVVIGYIFYQKAAELNGSLSWTALLALINAVILFLPNLMPTGNKDSRSLTPMEGMMVGAAGALGILPGISSMGGMVSMASLCGVERKFALKISVMAQMVVTVMLIIFDIAALFGGIGALTFGGFVGYLAAAAAAFLGVHVALRTMNVMADGKGFHVFAFHSLAVALLSFIFYLTV